MKTEKITQLNVDIPEKVKGKIKLVAALDNQSLKEIVAFALNEYAERRLKSKGFSNPFG